MNILAIDTSTHYLSMAVMKNNKVETYCHTSLPKANLSSIIISVIEKILKKAKIPLSSLDGFAVGLGPGSFTSLRVGLSTVKALCLATGKNVVGISSLDVIAMNVKQDHRIGVICDAKRNLLYACFYTKKGGQLTRESGYLLISPEGLSKYLTSETILVGDGIKLFKDGTRSVSNGHPQARNLALLALKRFEQNEVDDVRTLVPLYLYPEDCQVDKKKV